MRRFTILVLLLVGAFGATPALAAPIAATPPVEIKASNPIEDATVNLYCSLKSGKMRYSTSGSGVFISERGVILTNAHVARYFLLAGEKGRVRGECFVRTGSPAEATYTASVLYFPTAWIEQNADMLKKGTTKGTGEGDFALLYVTGAKKGVLPAAFPSLPLWLIGATEGETVTVAGYPTMNLGSKHIRNELSFVSATAPVTSIRTFSQGNDVFTIASSSAASAGVSGGPVVREGGFVTGIVAAKSDMTLRAITLSHINASLISQTGIGIFGMLAGDLATRAATNRALITPKQIIQLRDALLKVR